jgi:hypothetical protein
VPTAVHLAAKRRAIGAYVSQTTNLTGEPGWSFLPDRFVRMFLGPDELFLPVPAVPRPVRGRGVPRGSPGRHLVR